MAITILKCLIDCLHSNIFKLIPGEIPDLDGMLKSLHSNIFKLIPYDNKDYEWRVWFTF